MKRFLFPHLGNEVTDMPTDVLGSDGKTIVQEWDAVFRVGDVLYLCDAKHNMTLDRCLKDFKALESFKRSHSHKSVGFSVALYFLKM